MGLLSGLEAFGLGNLKNLDLYAEEKGEDKKKEEKKQVFEIREQDILFEKTYTCPVCDSQFKEKNVRAGKARLLGTDMDLRPNYEHIDTLKYDTVVCPHCGYAALGRYFATVTSLQKKMIRTAICANYKSKDYNGDIYSYDEAIERYKLTLANSIVKKAKASEKAYVCLKMGWLMRGYRSSLSKDIPDYDQKAKSMQEEENEYLKNALEGFLSARQSEPFPMCGMDEITMDYLLAALSIGAGEYDVAAKLLSSILGSTTASGRIKDKARDLKDELMKKMKG